nr:hypothetical protein [Tanacetum cinerariifolium]
MSSDSHATITYTSMSSYEVIVNGYYEIPMDPLDPYIQLVMGAPPSPDYIPGPEAPPLPDYIPRPEAPPSPDYIPGPNSVYASEETKPFKEGETAATPPPFGYRVAARISVQHVYLCHSVWSQRLKDYLPYLHHHYL